MDAKTGGPAFPMWPNDPQWLQEYGAAEGMTLRDYFAGLALQGYMANPTSFGPDVDDEAKTIPEMVAEVCATFAYMVADAMLKARES